jgi:CheY-like chemotaxis protein
MEHRETQEQLDRAGAEAAAGVVASSASELSDLLGTKIGLKAEPVAATRAVNAVADDSPIVVVMCKDESAPPTNVQILLSRETAATLAGVQAGTPVEELADSAKEPLDAGAIAGLRGALKIFVDSLGAALAPYLEGPLEIQDATEIEEPASDPTWLIGENFLRIRYAIEIASCEPSSVDVLLPSEAEEDDPTEGLRVLILDPDPASFQCDGLAEALGCEVEVVGAIEVVVQGAEAIGDAGAIVVPWHAHGRAGIDLVERLQADPETKPPRIVMNDENPTRSMVIAALGAGATGFIHAPIDANELAIQLGINQREVENTEEDAPNDAVEQPASA